MLLLVDVCLYPRIRPVVRQDVVSHGRCVSMRHTLQRTHAKMQLFLVEAGPLQPRPPVDATVPLEAIRSSRLDYKNIFLEKMRAPDGGYEEGVIIPGTNLSPPRTERTGGNLDLNNPLSLHDEVCSNKTIFVLSLDVTLPEPVDDLVHVHGSAEDNIARCRTNVSRLNAAVSTPLIPA